MPELPYEIEPGQWVIAIDSTGGQPGWTWSGHSDLIIYTPETGEIYQENCAGAYSRPWREWPGLTEDQRSMIHTIQVMGK